MRIEKIEGYDFPITIQCDTKGCGTTFTVNTPDDMQRVGIWTSGLVDNVIQPPRKIGEQIQVFCPCCGEMYRANSESIPPMLLKRIRYDKSSDPVHWH